MKSFDLSSQNDVQALFVYEAGVLKWKTREDCPKHWNGKFAGKAAGSPNSLGYFKIKQNGKFYRRSRIVWVFHHGSIPEGMQIDHINRNPSDDRIENLRLATGSENCRNMQSRGSQLGFRGVAKAPHWARYQARISANGVLHHLGMFDTKEQAAAAYKNAADSLHGEFSILNSSRAKP